MNKLQYLERSLVNIGQDVLINIDESISKAVENSPSWFKKKLGSDTVAELYRSQLRKNAGFAPTFKIKFPTKAKSTTCNTNNITSLTVIENI